MNTDSFKTRTHLQVGAKRHEIFSLETLAKAHPAVEDPSILAPGAAGEPAPPRGRPGGEAGARREDAGLERQGRAGHRDLLPRGPGAPPGLHRRARRWWTWRRCARRWPSSAATPTGSTPAIRRTWSSTTRWWWTSSAASQAFQANAELEFERNRERYAFLRWGQRAFRNFRVVPPDTGICHQVNLEFLAQVVFRDGEPALPRHAGGHRLPHHDGERAGGGRLGRGRHRGRGGAARPAALDAHPPGGRLPPHRQAARGRDRHRPGPHRDPDAPQAGRGGEVRRVLRAGHRPALAPRPGHHRQHGAGVRRDHRLLPGGRRDAGLPPLHRTARGAPRRGGGVLQGAGAVPHPRRGRADLLRSPRARPGQGGAEPRRTQAAAGPGPAQGEQGHLPEEPAGDAQHRAAGRRRCPGDAPPRPSRRRASGAGAPGGQRVGDPGHAELPARPRGGGDRRHHLLHQHHQSGGAAGRGPPGEEGGGARPGQQALGEDLARSGEQGGDGLPPLGGAAPLPRGAGLPPGGLRLHHLHRELRAACPTTSPPR